ncbi:MAG: hypothetical protein AAGC91_01145 [Pseudomonadota bacterium]
MTTSQIDLIDNSIRDPLLALQGVAITASDTCNDQGIEQSFHAIRILSDKALAALDVLEKELSK